MTIARIMRRDLVEGDLGIEVEVEGARLPRPERYWHSEHDGSLRGESREYVFDRPRNLKETKKALEYLVKCYKDNKTRVNDSDRCGVHVHVNCQNLSIIHTYNFMTLYLIFEEILVKWCGPSREGNLFCLRAKDAEYLLYVLMRAAHREDFRRMFATDELRYASMNVRALPQYGSLEFRAMRGTSDMDLIYRWAKLLLNLREVAKSFDNPREIIMATSEGGNEGFLRGVFSEEDAEEFLSMPNWGEMMQEGVRRTQDLGFCVDWEELATFPKRKVGGIAVSPDWDDDWPPADM